MLVQAVVAEFAVEAFDVAVLHRLSRFDQNVANVMFLCPADDRAAGEPRSIIRAHDPRVTLADR